MARDGLYADLVRQQIQELIPIDVEVQEQRPWDVIYLSSVNHTSVP